MKQTMRWQQLLENLVNRPHGNTGDNRKDKSSRDHERTTQGETLNTSIRIRFKKMVEVTKNEWPTPPVHEWGKQERARGETLENSKMYTLWANK